MKLNYLASLIIGLTIGMAACGKQSYVPVTQEEKAQAIGTFTIKPKVDIVLFEDDTGSIKESYNQVAAQLPVFLNQLESQGWNYHFATIPLTQRRAVTEVITSKHDENWGSQWTPPYPGAPRASDPESNPANVLASVFRIPGEYSGFLGYDDSNNSLNGYEPGLQNISAMLQDNSLRSGSRFLRQDAMLAVIVLGNGDDTSGVQYCRRADRVMVPCENVLTQAQCQANPSQCTYNSSLNSYQNQIRSVKPGNLIRFYSAVANRQTSNCLGGSSIVGTRYQKVAQNLGGISLDVCSQSLNSVLSGIGKHLSDQVVSFHTRYVFISQRPNPATIKVYRVSGSSRSLLPQSASNGWTFTDSIISGYAIDYPSNLNFQTGYAIELHGPAKILGNDQISVEFLPYGATPGSG